MASVRKRKWTHRGVTKEGWQVNYIDMAGKRRSGGTYKRKKDADRRKREIESEIEGGVHTAASTTKTVASAAAQFLRWYDQRWKSGEITGATVHNVELGMKMQVIPAFGGLKLTAVTTEIIQTAIYEWATRYRCHGTVDRGRKLIKQTLDFAVQKGWLKRNVMKDNPPKMPKLPRKEVAIPSKAELEAIVQVLEQPRQPGEPRLDHRNRRALIFLAIYTGMREGEILGLQWENVDFDTNAIRVKHSQSYFDGLKGPKTPAGIRPVWMNRPVREALLGILEYWQVEGRVGETSPRSRQMRNCKIAKAVDQSPAVVCLDKQSLPTGYVLLGRKRKPIQATSIGENYLQPVLCKAGLMQKGQKAPYTFHSFRHEHVSLLVEAGVPPMQISKLVGHANVSITLSTYAHIFPNDDLTRRAIDQIGGQFGKAATEQQKLLTLSKK